MRYKNIVWDWNGTLLNDLMVGVNTLNSMLLKRDLPGLSATQYKDSFGFPVIDFYKEVGFDFAKESFHELSQDFVVTYDHFAKGITLNNGVRDVLHQIREAGTQQYILSALREDLLQGMVYDFQIDGCFTQVCGSDNIYAAGKVERGKRMVEQYNIPSRDTLMVGDTLHDAEVAEALGFDCILYAGGHNSEWRLEKKAPVITEMEELWSILNG